jgi:hypothetical protein
VAFVRRALRGVKWLALVVAVLLCGPLLTLAVGDVSMRGDWRTATHRATGLAPDPAAHPEAIVQIYASRTSAGAARSPCTWIAAKPPRVARYTRYEVIGWHYAGRSGLSVTDDGAPDAEWYGAAPTLIDDIRGTSAEVVIANPPDAAASYPYSTIYRAWPGPTAIRSAHVGRAIPELALNLPSSPSARTIDRSDSSLCAPSAPDTMSLGGIVGVTLARVEGLEINLSVW